MIGPVLNLEWSRANSELVAKLLSVQCGCQRKDTYRYILPALLLWDLMYPNSDDVVFKAVSVSGECIVGLADDEQHDPSKRLAVVEWCSITDANVSGDLLRALNETPRAKRSVPKQIAIQFCPDLVESFCASEVRRLLRGRSKSQEEVEEVARTIYCNSWGFLHLPASAMSDCVKMARAIIPEPKKKQRNLYTFFKVQRD